MREGRSAVERLTGDEDFAAALRLAIQASGLTLESLRYRLGQRGVHVSAASLSYWQGGRSRPERADSIVAVGMLEEVLDLPKGALTDLLKPRRPRGQTCNPAHPARLWPDPEPVIRTLSHLDQSCDHRLEWLSVHDVCDIGADRRPSSLSVRLVLRASGDDVDRVIAVHNAEAATEPPPVLGEVRYCRRGRVRYDGRFVAFELFFDRILARGDTIIVEYELLFPGARMVANFYDRRFRHAVREYLCIIRFDRGALPVRCYRYDCESVDLMQFRRTEELWVGASCNAHITEHDIERGIVGLDWEWE